jgi:general secretion pathway protein D
MTRRFRKVLAIASALAFTIAPVVTGAQSDAVESNTTALSTILAAVAKSSGKKFIVDPRVRADVQLLQNPASLTYDDFLMLIQVHGFAAVTNGDYVRVVPDANIRHMAIPTVVGDTHPLAEYVTRVVSVKSVPAAMLVPLLRPLIPQQGHLVALPCTNNLIVVDTFGNVQRLEKIIQSLDRGEPYKPEKCSMSALASATDKSRAK